MKRIGIAAGLIACISSHVMAQPAAAPDLLQKTIEKFAKDDSSAPGIIMALSAPRLGLEWAGTAGSLARDSREPLRVTDAFRLASVTKVYTSATVFRLIEEKKFGLYDAIEGLVSPEISKILQDGGYDPKAITVHELLSHTSGVCDYATTDEYFDQVFSQLDRVWTPKEQIKFATTYCKPIGKPGEKYEYSDTGYVILGQIIERATGEPLGKAVAQKLEFKKFGLNATYFENAQAAPEGERRIHQYYGDIDTIKANPSMDLFGGGGLVSTVGDLIHFIRPLARGEMFTKETTLAAALVAQPLPKGDQVPPLMYLHKFGKRTCLNHGGFWGVEMMYCPDIDLALAFSYGQVKREGEAIFDQIAEIVEEVEAGTVKPK